MNIRDAQIHLQTAGKRLTPQRDLLLRLVEENAHSDAKEIFQLARQRDPRIGLATVYRTLKLLRQLGLVNACAFGEDHGHYEVTRRRHCHLVCRECGRVIEIPSIDRLWEIAEQRGFGIAGASVEIAGTCRECRTARIRRERAIGESSDA